MSFIGNLYNRESLLCINNCVEHVNEATYGKALASYTPVVNTCRMTNGSKANKIPKNRNITSLEEPKLSKVPENGFIGVCITEVILIIIFRLNTCRLAFTVVSFWTLC